MDAYNVMNHHRKLCTNDVKAMKCMLILTWHYCVLSSCVIMHKWW